MIAAVGHGLALSKSSAAVGHGLALSNSFAAVGHGLALSNSFGAFRFQLLRFGGEPGGTTGGEARTWGLASPPHSLVALTRGAGGRGVAFR